MEELTRRLAEERPGFRHAAAAGVWVMLGRDLPHPFSWSSLPPAASLSWVWGRGACHIRHAGPSFSIGPGEAMWIDAGHPHRGDGAPGSDFLTLFVPAWDLRQGTSVAQRAALSPDLLRLLCQTTLSVLAGRPALKDIRTLEQLGDTLRPASTSRAQPSALRRARRLLEERYREPVRLQQLAEAADRSASHTSRAMTTHWGIGAVQYRKQLRLLAATRALRDGRSVTRAALEAGFSDAAHLSRTFRRQYGIAPLEWQRRVSTGLVRPLRDQGA